MTVQFFLPLMTYPDQTSEQTIVNAVELVRNRGGRLQAVAVDIDIPPITNPWSTLLIDTERMVREAEQASSQQGERLVNILKHHALAAGISYEHETLLASAPDATDVVTQVARHYDTTLLQAADYFRPLSEAVIFGSGRPVVLYPDKPVSGRVDHVAIAWDGSRAAARALGDATAFIDSASQVSVIHALDEKPSAQDPGRRLFDSLKARGVKAEAYPVQTHGEPIGDVLQAKAVDIGADLLVMGGYGHSRMREFVLGGATAHVLSNVLLPVLMSH